MCELTEVIEGVDALEDSHQAEQAMIEGEFGDENEVTFGGGAGVTVEEEGNLKAPSPTHSVEKPEELRGDPVEQQQVGETGEPQKKKSRPSWGDDIDITTQHLREVEATVPTLQKESVQPVEQTLSTGVNPAVDAAKNDLKKMSEEGNAALQKLQK